MSLATYEPTGTDSFSPLCTPSSSHMTYSQGQPVSLSLKVHGSNYKDFPHSSEAPGLVLKTRTKQLKEEKKPMSSSNRKGSGPCPHLTEGLLNAWLVLLPNLKPTHSYPVMSTLPNPKGPFGSYSTSASRTGYPPEVLFPSLPGLFAVFLPL